MTFANPKMLTLMAVALPVLGLFVWWSWRRKQALVASFAGSRLLAQLTRGVSWGAQKLRLILLLVAVALLFLTLARPQWGSTAEEVRQRGLDIVVAIDTSRSMLAEDVSPNRLERAKLAALDLMRLAPQDRLGLVAFAGTAFLQCPLTLDNEAFRQNVAVLNVGIIPQGGTVLAAAIQESLRAFSQDHSNIKVMVLFSDGEDHEPGALEVAQNAAVAGLRIFTIGVGTPLGELLRVREPDGKINYIRDAEGGVVKSQLNQDLLGEIAAATGGFYVPLSGANPMELLYERGLKPLPRAELATREWQKMNEQFYWPLLLAIACLIAELFISDRKRARPRREPSALMEQNLARTLVVGALVLGGLSAPLLASPAKALRQYERGEFKEAQTEYERLLEKKPADPRLRYNAGAAAYQSDQYLEAIRHFGEALTAPDLRLQQRAYYNLGNAFYSLGERLQDRPSRNKAWEQSAMHFESALKIDGDDSDAQFNLEWVREKLQELQEQQQPEQQPQGGEGDKQQEPSDEEGESSEKMERENRPGDQEQQEKGEQDASAPPSEQQDSNGERGNAGEAGEEESEGEDQPGQQGAEGEEGTEEGASESQTEGPPGGMTREQAEQLLDAVRPDEQPMIFRPPAKRQRDLPLKDW